MGDYDGDLKADPAVWRPSDGTWYIAQSSNNYTIVSFQFGQSGDIPVAGDYDGDGALDKAVYRPTGGYWYVLGSTSGFISAQWGLASDIPVPADYDGDNKTDYAVYRASSGTWYAYKSSTNNGAYLTQTWGNYGDQPVPADYDGDGLADFTVWRPVTGVWHSVKSSDSTYSYTSLGINGDKPTPAAYLKQIGSSVQGYDLAKARLSPKNATGGTNLYSRNFSWGTSLVGLPGRAGLDAGFGLSYNSLVWTKQGSSIYFDTDNSNVSPGFRFGFPVIEPIYYDGSRSFNYLMVSPSGARIEFRQVNGASDTYQTADSSYTQLKTIGASNPNDPVENISVTVNGTDGSKMTFEWKAGAFRCSQIKDRNGNYVEINHDEYGLLRTVTDTLGRVITVNYDSEFYPISITQDWKDNNGQGANVTHVWASFTYGTQEIATSFSATGITNIVGPPNGTILKVLKKVTYPNGSSTQFEYNSYGQVWQVINYAADNPAHWLNQVRTNLQSPSSGQTDCPRFTETYSKAENFNNNQEVLIKNFYDEGVTYTLPDNSQATGTRVEVRSPNGEGIADKLITRIYTASSGWAENLPVLTEDWADEGSGLSKKRWSWTNWTQDNTNLSYIKNPRVTETKVGDETNTKRTTIEYLTAPNTNIVQYGLVSAINVYAENQTSVLKRIETDYNLDSAYTSKRIIGLPLKTEAWGMNQQTNLFEKVSKVTYGYDEENFTYEANQNISSVIRHDNSNFSSSFVVGRGNLTSTTRHDATGLTSSVTSKIRYDIAGSPVAKIDPLNRKIRIEYADGFNDATQRNTYAYPTKLYDSANNYSK